MTNLSSESPTHPDAPRAGGETADILAELDRYLDAYRDAIIAEQYAGPEDAATDPDVDRAWERANKRREALQASLLARHRDGERAEWHRRMSDEHCGTDEIVGYGPYHAEMLSDEALFLELGEEIFTVYFDKKKPCLNDGRAHRKGVLQMRYEETRARSAPPSPERASK